MSSTQPRIRFTVNLDGVPREIFSVEERVNGDLLIPIVREDRYANLKIIADGELSPRTTQSYLSVHRSPRSDGRSIKSTICTADGLTRTAHAFVRNSKKTLCWPLFSKSIPILDQPQYEHRPRSRDKVILLCDAPPLSSTLIVHAIAFSRYRDPPVYGESGLSIVDFRYFKIAVYFNFVNLPASDASCTAQSVTASPIENGAKIDPFPESHPHLKFGAVSLHDLEVPATLYAMNERVAYGMWDLMAAQIGKTEVLKIFGDHRLLYTRHPIQPGQVLVTTDGADL